MLTKEVKEAALKRLDEMTAEDFIKAFEEIGSERIKGGEQVKDICAFIDEELERYGIIS